MFSSFFFRWLTASVAASLLLLSAPARADFLDHYNWVEINSGSGVTWEARAGLQAVKHRGKFYVLGGRMPKIMPLAFGDSVFFNDTWESGDGGQSWELVSSGAAAPWAARAYFQALTRGRYMYVIGGQDSTAIPNPDPTCGGFLPPGVPCPAFILGSDLL